MVYILKMVRLPLRRRISDTQRYLIDLTSVHYCPTEILLFGIKWLWLMQGLQEIAVMLIFLILILSDRMVLLARFLPMMLKFRSMTMREAMKIPDNV